MSNNAPDYEDNLAFDPDINTMPRCDVETLKSEIKSLKELLKECKEFFYENLIDTEFHFSCGLGSDIKKQNCMRSLSKLKTKIDEVLK